MVDSDEYDDPRREEAWLDAQRTAVLAYLEREEVGHGGVAREPDWFLAPYLAVWRVLSPRRDEATGWWAVSGDVPTDYLSGHDAEDARTALRGFAARWSVAAERMQSGQAPEGFTLGGPAQRLELGELLSRRAALLDQFAADDTMW